MNFLGDIQLWFGLYPNRWSPFPTSTPVTKLAEELPSLLSSELLAPSFRGAGIRLVLGRVLLRRRKVLVLRVVSQRRRGR